MDEKNIFWLVVVGIGIVIKLFEHFTSRNNNSSDTSFSSPPAQDREITWEELFANARRNNCQQEYSTAEPPAPEAYAYTEVSGDVRILAEQQQYQMLAEQAAACNRSSVANESSAIYRVESETVQEQDTEDPANIDWVSIIRNNRTEAVILSEILSPPPSLR